MRGNRGLAPRRSGHGDAVTLVDESSQIVAERFTGGPEVADDLGDFLLQRHQFPADRLGQGAEHLLGLLGPKSGHGPLDLGRSERLRQVRRKPQRDAVPLFAGRVGVEQRHGAVVEADGVGERFGVEVDRLVADEILLRGLQRLAVGGFAEPAVQLVAGRDVLQPLAVELAEQLVQIADVVAANACLPAFDLLTDAEVVGEEGVLGDDA